MKRTIEPGKTPAAWDPDALLMKAQRYAELMVAAEEGSFQQGLAAALSLELLARAALGNVSPILLVDGKEAWQQTLKALGYPALEVKVPQSVPTSAVLTRLQAVYPATFTKEVSGNCSRIAGDRNAELHSGEVPFDGKPSAAWQPEFYEACKILLDTMGMGLDEFVGDDEAKVADKLIAAKADKGARAVAGEIDAHKVVWDAKDEPSRDREIAAAAAWATKLSGHRVNCPACDCVALVYGDPVAPPQTKLESNLIVETQDHLPTHFECVACGLKINGLSRLTAAGLGQRYKRTRTYDPAEYYGPPEDFPDFEEDNNEPF